MPTIEDVLLPPPLIQIIVDQHWIPLAIPDSKMTPGAIFSVTTGDPTLRWEGDLGDCFPKDVIKTVTGSSPTIHLESSREFSLDALLQIFGLGFTGSLSPVKKAVLDITDWGTDDLNLIKLSDWDHKNYSQLSSTYVAMFNKVSTLVVQHALVVRKATYSLTDEFGASIKLDNTNIGNVTFGGDVKFSFANDGKLTVEKPTVFAVKECARTGVGIYFDWNEISVPEAAAGGSQPATVDEQLMQLFLKSPQKKG